MAPHVGGLAGRTVMAEPELGLRRLRSIDETFLGMWTAEERLSGTEEVSMGTLRQLHLGQLLQADIVGPEVVHCLDNSSLSPHILQHVLLLPL